VDVLPGQVFKPRRVLFLTDKVRINTLVQAMPRQSESFHYGSSAT